MSMGSDEVHLQVLGELADRVGKPLSKGLKNCGSQLKFMMTGKSEL